MLHAIGNYQVTAFKGLAIEELEIDLPFHLVKEGNAGTENDDRMSSIGRE